MNTKRVHPLFRDSSHGDLGSDPTQSQFGSLMGPASDADVVIVTGISGSGKSVALHALEDAGFFCVDNLPPELLRDCLKVQSQRRDEATRRLAVAVDVRSAETLQSLVPLLRQLAREGVAIRSIFLDASTDALVRRFSETRRPHPLSTRNDPSTLTHALVEAIELERGMLADLRESSIVVDTSQLRAAQLRSWILQMVGAPSHAMTLVFESFAFKHGVPLDADFVFDVRVLPNPYYERELRSLTGRDDDVALYLQRQPEVAEMLGHIGSFLSRWLPVFRSDHRSYLTVAIGCTGGQHRSVYIAEQLAKRHAAQGHTLVRHRELDGRESPPHA